MRYYFIDQEQNNMFIEISKLETKDMVSSFELKNNKSTQIFHVRPLAGKYFYSEDMLVWKLISASELPKILSIQNQTFRISKGFLPSGLNQAGEGALMTKMPGKVVRVLVTMGQKVKTGEPLFILEAMKMENEIKASRDGIIKSIQVSEGQSVDSNIMLGELEDL